MVDREINETIEQIRMACGDNSAYNKCNGYFIRLALQLLWTLDRRHANTSHTLCSSRHFVQ